MGFSPYIESPNHWALAPEGGLLTEILHSLALLPETKSLLTYGLKPYPSTVIVPDKHLGVWMRKAAWGLLLLFAFAIPWEYSLDLGEPLGNIARIVGLVVLLAAVPAVLQAGRVRTPGPIQWMVLALYLWFCCSYFWTIEPLATLEKMRGYFQEMMIVWLVWEFADSPQDLRSLLQAYVAGAWMLAALTLANFSSAEAIAAGQIRFVAEGQDPNDVARYLDLGLSSGRAVD